MAMRLRAPYGRWIGSTEHVLPVQWQELQPPLLA
jgi:hypothetical protein